MLPLKISVLDIVISPIERSIHFYLPWSHPVRIAICRAFLATPDCSPSGGAVVGGGDCDALSGGCCDFFMECSENGMCSIPAASCTPDSCEDGEVCAMGSTCVPLGASTLTADTDIDSPYVGVLTYDSQEIFFVGEKDSRGRATRVTEATRYYPEADIAVHIVFDESGVVTSAYFDGRDEVVKFAYDVGGNLVSVTEDGSSGRRRLDQSGVVQHYSSLQASFRGKHVVRSLADDEDCVQFWDAVTKVVVTNAYCLFLGAAFSLLTPLAGAAASLACGIGFGIEALGDEVCPDSTPSPTTAPGETAVTNLVADALDEDGTGPYSVFSMAHCARPKA